MRALGGEPASPGTIAARPQVLAERTSCPGLLAELAPRRAGDRPRLRPRRLASTCSAPSIPPVRWRRPRPRRLAGGRGAARATTPSSATFDGARPAVRRTHSVDVVFCKQVLEHVERPSTRCWPTSRRVLRARRVASPGSTSQLEPFHSRSIGELARPYGLERAARARGRWRSSCSCPAIDAPTLIGPRLPRGCAAFNRWWIAPIAVQRARRRDRARPAARTPTTAMQDRPFRFPVGRASIR